MQPTSSRPYSFGPAAASASPQPFQQTRLLAASAAGAVRTQPNSNPNQRILESEETERLTSLLEMETKVGHQTNSLKKFIDTFTLDVLGLMYPNSITLKGGATNFVLMGKRIHYSDIDIDVKIDDSIDLDQLRQVLNAWAKKNNIRFKNCMLVQDQFIVVTIPSTPKDLDIQFTLSPPHTCTCTYNALRIELLPIIKESNGASTDHSIPPMLKTVDDYDLEECLSDLKTRRSRSKNPKEIYDGLRSYVSSLVKGVVPKNLADEKGFCLGLYDQYRPQKFYPLQSALVRYIDRHFEQVDDHQIGRIIYLLTYAEVIRRAYFPQLSEEEMSLTAAEQASILSKQKEGILYDIAALLSVQLGCSASGFRGDLEKTEAFFDGCRLYLFKLYKNMYSLKGEDVPVIDLNEKFNLILIDEKKGLHLFIPKVTRHTCEHFSMEALYATSCPLLQPRFRRLVDFFPQPTAPSVEPERPVSPLMIEPSPAAASASSIPSSRQELYGLVAELSNAEMDSSIRDEKTNRVIELLKKIGHLNNDRQNTLGKQITENATHLLAENNLFLCTELYIEAMRLCSFENLNKFPHLEQLLDYLLKNLETIVEESKEDSPSPSMSRLNNIQKIIGFLLFSYKKMSPSQKECSNQRLNRLSRPQFFSTTLDVLWKKCLSLKKEENFSLNTELKAIIQQFISGVLKQPQSEASACYPHLFSSFSLVTQKGEPTFDSVFIQQMSPSFYLSIRAELQLLGWQRFLPFFNAFNAHMTVGSSSSLTMSTATATAAPSAPNNNERVDVEAALLEGISYLIKEIHDHEIIQDVLTEICTEPLLRQFPSINKLCKKYLEFPDEHTFIETLRERIAPQTEPVEKSQATYGSYSDIGSRLSVFFKQFHFSIVSRLIEDVHQLLIDQEALIDLALKSKLSNKKSVLIALPGSVAATAASAAASASSSSSIRTLHHLDDIKKLEQSSYSELITFHISLLVHSKNHFHAAIFLFKKAIRRNWLTVKNFETCYTTLYKIFPQLTIECRESLARTSMMGEISESQRFFCGLTRFQIALDSFFERKDKSDLDCAIDALKGLQPLYQTNNSMLETGYTATFTALNRLIQFFKNFNESSDFLCWSYYPALILEQLLSNKRRTQLWLKQSKENNKLQQAVDDALLLLAVSSDAKATQIFQRMPSEPSCPFNKGYESHVERAFDWIANILQTHTDTFEMTLQGVLIHLNVITYGAHLCLNRGLRAFNEKRYINAKELFINAIRSYGQAAQNVSNLAQVINISILQTKSEALSVSMLQACDYAGKSFYALNSLEEFHEAITFYNFLNEQVICREEFLKGFAPYFYPPTAELTGPNDHEIRLVNPATAKVLGFVHYQLKDYDTALYFLGKATTMYQRLVVQELSAKASSSQETGPEHSQLRLLSFVTRMVQTTKELSSTIHEAYQTKNPQKFNEAMAHLQQLFVIPFNHLNPEECSTMSAIFGEGYAILIDLHTFINNSRNSALIPTFGGFPLAIADVITKNPYFIQAWLWIDSDNKSALIKTLKETMLISLKHKISKDDARLKNLINFIQRLSTDTLSFLNTPAAAAAAAASL